MASFFAFLQKYYDYTSYRLDITIITDRVQCSDCQILTINILHSCASLIVVLDSMKVGIITTTNIFLRTSHVGKHFGGGSYENVNLLVDDDKLHAE